MNNKIALEACTLYIIGGCGGVLALLQSLWVVVVAVIASLLMLYMVLSNGTKNNN